MIFLVFAQVLGLIMLNLEWDKFMERKIRLIYVFLPLLIIISTIIKDIDL